MYTRFLYIVLWLVFSHWAGVLKAQVDVVVLPDGTEVMGKLLQFDPAVGLSLEVAKTGEVRTFAEGEYQRLLQLAKRKVNMMPGDLTPLEQIVEEVGDQRVTLYFRDGSRSKGKILGYERGGNIRLQTTGNTIYHFSDQEVIAISFNGGKALARRYRELAFPTKPIEQIYAFREQGLFNHTSFAFTFGKSTVYSSVSAPIFFPSPEEDLVQQTTGFNVQHITGYQFNRWVGAGLGLAYDSYSLEGGEAMLSVFAHYRAYLTKHIRAPYFGLSVGCGFPWLEQDKGFLESEGGFMLHPKLGIRLGASDQANFTMDLGYRWQDAYFVQEEPFTRDILYRDILYCRLVFSLGLLF
ncbi:MAG: hypothetical protein D6772_09110 [Bacteroidetes bacterium]|nr:MAG: hypothetical protein D6772_09110 [Bacteroidota bacterium]